MNGRPPMRSSRRGERVPGFPAEDADRPAPGGAVRGRAAGAEGSGVGVEDYRDAPLRHFTTRLLDPLHGRYRHLVRELEDEGYRVSMNELVHAVLYGGPRTPAEARAVVRAWRRVLDPD